MSEDERTLFVGGVPAEMTDDMLYELFLQAGPLERVNIPKDKDGTQKKFGFVVFKHESSVPYSIDLFQGTKIFGRELMLKRRNNPKPDDASSSANEGPTSQGTRNMEYNAPPVPLMRQAPMVPGLMPNSYGTAPFQPYAQDGGYDRWNQHNNGQGEGWNGQGDRWNQHNNGQGDRWNGHKNGQGDRWSANPRNDNRRQVFERDEPPRGRQVYEQEDRSYNRQVHEGDNRRNNRQVYERDNEQNSRKVYERDNGQNNRQVYERDNGRNNRQVFEKEGPPQREALVRNSYGSRSDGDLYGHDRSSGGRNQWSAQRSGGLDCADRGGRHPGFQEEWKNDRSQGYPRSGGGNSHKRW